MSSITRRMSPNLSEIADAIEREAIHLPESAPRNAPKAEITVGPLTVRCKPTHTAAKAMAAKYRKGVSHGGGTGGFMNPTKPAANLRPRFSRQQLDDFLADDEWENARQYAALHGERIYSFRDAKGNYCPIYQAKPLTDDPRFVLGKVGGYRGYRGRIEGWKVTHIASGLAATSAHSTAKAAVDEFLAIDPDKLEAALAKAPAMGETQTEAQENRT